MTSSGECTEADIRHQEEQYKSMLEALANQWNDEAPIGYVRKRKESPEIHSADGGDQDEGVDDNDDEDEEEDDDEDEVDFDVGDYDTPDVNELEEPMEDIVNDELPPWS
jgi:hypothetical protein